MSQPCFASCGLRSTLTAARPISRSSDHPITRFPAFIALASFPQIVPGVNTAGVAVIPTEVERVAAHRLDLFGLDRLLIHGQQRRRCFRRLARLAMVVVAVFGAGGTRTCITQPLESVV